jgi:hypothetical protein
LTNGRAPRVIWSGAGSSTIFSMRLLGTALILLCLGLSAGACGSGGSRPETNASASPSPLTDAERLWCGAHTKELLEGAGALGLQPIGTVRSLSYLRGNGPSDFDDLKAAVEAENALAQRWPRYKTTSVQPGSGYVYNWYADADYPRVCKAAFAAR